MVYIKAAQHNIQTDEWATNLLHYDNPLSKKRESSDLSRTAGEIQAILNSLVALVGARDGVNIPTPS